MDHCNGLIHYQDICHYLGAHFDNIKKNAWRSDCTLPCELRSGDFLEPGKPADLWECSLGFSKNSEVFLVGKTTLLINSCAHYLLGLTATLIVLLRGQCVIEIPCIIYGDSNKT